MEKQRLDFKTSHVQGAFGTAQTDTIVRQAPVAGAIRADHLRVGASGSVQSGARQSGAGPFGAGHFWTDPGRGGIVLPDDSACNLASLNLLKFLREDGTFDVEAFEHAARLFLMAQEILVDLAGYPSAKIAKNSHDFRPLGLGFANLGALLMALGLPYDSDEGRSMAGAIMAVEQFAAADMTGRMAAVVGPYPRFEENREPYLKVMNMHRDAAYQMSHSGSVWSPSEETYVIASDGEQQPDVTYDIWNHACFLSDEAVSSIAQHGARNAQLTVLAPTGCLVANALIQTDEGLRRIGRLGATRGDSGQDVGLRGVTDGAPRQATKPYVHGEAETRKVKTRFGYTIQGTEMHRVRVVEPNTGAWGWRMLADLRAGDVVPMEMNTMRSVARTVPLPGLGKMHGNATPVRAPESVTPDLAELVGYFMAGGSLHRKGLRLCVSDEDVERHLTERIRGVFGIEPYACDEEGYRTVGVNSVPLRRWWEACGFAKLVPSATHSGKGYTPHVPDAILETNHEAVYAAFLRGLFEEDGTITSGLPDLSTAAESLASDVRTMLLALGIPTATGLGTSGLGSTIYRVRVKSKVYNGRFLALVGFISERKTLGVDLSIKGRPKNDLIYPPRELVASLTEVGTRERTAAFASLGRSGAISRGMAEDIVERTGSRELARLTGYFYDVVGTNTDGGRCPTYALSATGNSATGNVSFVANGFVSRSAVGLVDDARSTRAEPDLIVKHELQAGAGGDSTTTVNRVVQEGLVREGPSAQAQLYAPGRGRTTSTTAAATPSTSTPSSTITPSGFFTSEATSSTLGHGHAQVEGTGGKGRPLFTS